MIIKKRFLFPLIGAVVVIGIIALSILAFLNMDDRGKPFEPEAAKVQVPGMTDQIKRGEYLARTGDCVACHTSRGGVPLSGGLAMGTPFGTIYTPNITSDKKTGIGDWSFDDFWRALHNGKGKDGLPLYPAFPFTNYTKVSPADARAIYDYLQSTTPVDRENTPLDMPFPFSFRPMLYGWRAMFFRPGIYEDDKAQSAEWNRGAYLVEGLGHCDACHSARNPLGGIAARDSLAGGFIPIVNWYAPALTSDKESGLGDWEVQHVTDLLKHGVSAKGAVYGPMSEVVSRSTQFMTRSDVDAMSVYLKSLTRNTPKESAEAMHFSGQDQQTLALGKNIYEQNCAVCHRSNGAGMPPAYPPLEGNHSITMDLPVNAIRIVLNGGFPPATEGNPRPYGMPPFGHALNDREIAAVVSYVRNSWGNKNEVTLPSEVTKFRDVPQD